MRAQWDRDLVTMSSRIAGMREALYKELDKLGEYAVFVTTSEFVTYRFRLEGTPGDWKRILEQKGMFCILELNLEKVLELRGM